MAELAPEERQNFKDSVFRAITEEGQGKKARKRFKKAVARSMAKISTLPVHKRMVLEATAMELIDELWKEVVHEQRKA